MNTRGRTIRLFLVDGTTPGMVTAEVLNWTGKLLLVSRSETSRLKDPTENVGSCVYFLVGDDPEVPGREKVYVGETNNPLRRFSRHQGDDAMQFWSRTILVVSKDGNLTKGHALYLENRLIAMARDAGRATIHNTNSHPQLLPESDMADMEYFLSQVALVLPVLGYSFLQPKISATQATPTAPPVDAGPEFELTQGEKIRAFARELNGQFIVLRGSLAKSRPEPSFPRSFQQRREALISQGQLRQSADPDLYAFAEDVAFDSPSGAAAAILAMNANGRKHWRLKGSAKTYGDWQEEKLREALKSTQSGEDERDDEEID